MRTMSIAITAILSLCVTQIPCWGQSEAAQETDALSMLEAVRSAYADRRDKDVLLLADRALLGVTKAGGVGLRIAELHFWRGAALRRLGRHEEALVALDQAKALGFREPELYLERSLTHSSLGHSQESDLERQEGERLLPDDLERRERLNYRWQQEAKDRTRLQLWFSPQFGYDSNIIGLDDDTPLQQGDVDFDSSFVGAYLDARYFLVRNENQILRLNYQALVREYPDESDVSYVDNVVALVGRQPLLEYLDLEVRASLEEAFLRDDGHFRSQRTVGPALLMQPFHEVQIRLWGDWTDADYYASVPQEQDRDGEMVRGGVSFAIDLGRSWTIAPYASYNKYDAEGADYDSSGWEVGVTITPEAVAGILISPSISYGEQDYDNLNSFANFTKKREDRPLRATLTITIRALEKVIGYAPTLSISYVRHRSNVDAFDYTRWSPVFEVGINVLSF